MKKWNSVVELNNAVNYNQNLAMEAKLSFTLDNAWTVVDEIA